MLKKATAAALFVVTLWLCASPASAQPVVKKEPNPKTMLPGSLVFVDDGTCPRGQIKEFVAGNDQENPRPGKGPYRRCVPRPATR